MGAIKNFLMLSVIMQIGLWLFVGSDATSATSLTAFILNPSGWSTNELFSYFNAGLFAFGIGAAAIVAGLYFIRNEWLVYAGIGAVFMSFMFPIIDFVKYMNAQNLFGGAGTLIGILLGIPIFVGFVITILDFTRGRD